MTSEMADSLAQKLLGCESVSERYLISSLQWYWQPFGTDIVSPKIPVLTVIIIIIIIINIIIIVVVVVVVLLLLLLL